MLRRARARRQRADGTLRRAAGALPGPWHERPAAVSPPDQPGAAPGQTAWRPGSGPLRQERPGRQEVSKHTVQQSE